jgi:hypothetical protein
MKHDDLYHATKRRLDKWRHLGSAVLVFFVFGGMVFLASAAAATINGGGY